MPDGSVDAPGAHADGSLGDEADDDDATASGPWAGNNGDDTWWKGEDTGALPLITPRTATARTDSAEPTWLPSAVTRVSQQRGAVRSAASDTARPAARSTNRAPGRPPRSPAALFALVPLALVAAFFGWVTATPLLLSSGHSATGTATVTRCTGPEVTHRCVGSFHARDGFTVATVQLLGVGKSQRSAGSQVAARMVNPGSRQAYAGDVWALHLRWLVGLLLTILCGKLIARVSGATRLESAQARRRATLGAYLGPLLLLLGFLVAAW